MKKIYFVRHGETDANLKEYEPTKQEPLNAKGFLQAEEVAERVKTISFDKLMASDLLRAQQTAQAIAKVKPMPIITQPLFAEMAAPTSIFGLPYTHESVQSFRRNRNENVENPEWSQEDGENLPDIFERIKKAKKFLEDDPAESILVASHSFFMQLFAAAILLNPEKPTKEWFALAKRLVASNTGVTLFTIGELGWELLMWNDHAHFAE